MSILTARIGKDHYKTIVETRHHQVLADEPRGIGTDQGPTPYDYLLAALGSCTVITLRMYADRKDWPVDEIKVELSQRRAHAEDCQHCDSKDGYVHLIEKKISFRGDLTGAQRKRLLDIADKCPVHKTLLHEIAIASSLAEQE